MVGRMSVYLLAPLALSGLAACSGSNDKAEERPTLNVLLIPADGGTESGTLADFRPVFDAVEKNVGVSFDLKVAQSYGAVVEAMCNGTADVAFVGPVSYLQAKERGCADLLAVAVKDGQSVYHAGIFSRTDSALNSLPDLKNKSIALGDVNSTTSFVFPVAMLLQAGIDPVKDLGPLRLAGSHSNSLAALIEGRVDSAALSLDSYEKALRAGVTGADRVRIIARSEPIPYPPIIMSSKLPDATKKSLKVAFETVHTAPDIRPEMIRGYGGAQVERYDVHYPAEKFESAAQTMALLTDQLKGEILKKSSER